MLRHFNQLFRFTFRNSWYIHTGYRNCILKSIMAIPLCLVIYLLVCHFIFKTQTGRNVIAVFSSGNAHVWKAAKEIAICNLGRAAVYYCICLEIYIFICAELTNFFSSLDVIVNRFLEIVVLIFLWPCTYIGLKLLDNTMVLHVTSHKLSLLLNDFPISIFLMIPVGWRA